MRCLSGPGEHYHEVVEGEACSGKDLERFGLRAGA